MRDSAASSSKENDLTFTTLNAPVPTSAEVTLLERRFVNTVVNNRLTIKFLRQVKLENFFDQTARKVARQLLEGKPISEALDPTEPMTSDEMRSSAEMINGYATMRSTMTYGQELHQASRQGDLDRVRKLMSTRPSVAGQSLGGSVSEASADYLKQVVKGTDFKQFDDPLTSRFPLETGAIHAIAAGPGGYKTGWSECLGWEISMKGDAVLDCSAELTKIPKFARYAQHVMGADVGLSAYVRGAVDTHKLSEAARIINANANLKMLTGTSNLYDIKDAIRHHHDTYGTRLVIIDFLQLISVPGTRGLYERLEVITGELKELGDELGIAQLWLSQLNKAGRGVDAKGAPVRPTMANAEGSGRIEQLAWSVAVIDTPRDSGVNPGLKETTVYFDKSRYGGTGPVKAYIRGEHYDFWLEGQKPLLDRVPSPLGSTALI
ncbi:hypothetical protein Dxin01_00107 [Deinococcus xinjiangensis]|uniref:SF4 helicase domain-containing protein n=1 Tax=Deinococcus xinjiangensis TaxID=457454 RepID=A0ABP9V555_9DEIO